MILFVIDYIDDAELHVVRPFFQNKQCDQEYVFTKADVAALFCNYYKDNPLAAQFAYNLAMCQTTRMTIKKRKITPVHSTYDLGKGYELTFITGRDETVCICEPLQYDKLIARHPGAKDLKSVHDSLHPLFDQYIKDAMRASKVLR